MSSLISRYTRASFTKFLGLKCRASGTGIDFTGPNSFPRESREIGKLLAISAVLLMLLSSLTSTY